MKPHLKKSIVACIENLELVCQKILKSRSKLLQDPRRALPAVRLKIAAQLLYLLKYGSILDPWIMVWQSIQGVTVCEPSPIP